MAAKKKPKAKKTKVAKHKPAAKKRPAAKSASNAAMRSVKSTGSDTPPYSQHAWRRKRYATLAEFWPFYLNEHAHASNRILHFIGSTLGLVILGLAIGTAKLWLIAPALVSGYAFAWVGHFFIEKNRPATFTYPIKSFISDWRMWYVVLTGKVDGELKKFGIVSK